MSFYESFFLKKQKKEMSRILAREEKNLLTQKQHLQKIHDISQKKHLDLLSEKNAVHVIKKIAASIPLNSMHIQQFPHTKKEKGEGDVFIQKSYICIRLTTYQEKNLWDFIRKITRHKDFDAISRLLSIKKIYNEKNGLFFLKGVYKFSCYELKSKKS